MGVCQSSLCQCNEEDAILQQTTTTTDELKNRRHGAKLKIDLFSPTNTDITTPGSTFITPRDGPLSLKSVISMTSLTLDSANTNSSGAEERLKQPSRFHFNAPSQPNDELLDSIIIEEDDLDGTTSNYDDQAPGICDHDIERTGKQPPPPPPLPVEPKKVILNPPLVAPPPGQAKALLQAAAREHRSVNGRMIQEFNKIRQRTSLARRKDEKTRKENKLEERKEDMKGYNNLWHEYQDIQKHVGEQQKAENQPSSKAVHSTSSFLVNFRKEMRYQQGEDDNHSCQSGPSLLSAVSLEAQKALYAEKRQARVARYQAMRKVQNATSTNNGNLSYFHARIQENAACFADPSCFEGAAYSPQYSPPRLQVTTNGTKITIAGQVDQVSIPDSEELASITDMEVVVDAGDKRRDDETSCITDADFESDYWLHRRGRAKVWRNAGTVKDDESLGSSLVSYGVDLPASVKSFGGFGGGCAAPNRLENGGTKKRGPRRKTLSKGVAELARIYDPTIASQQHGTIKERITELEKKMQQKHIIRDDERRSIRDRAPMIDIQSPVVDHHGGAFGPSEELEPTKLEAMFDESSDIRERIVLKNCARSKTNAAALANAALNRRKERFQNDHAMVQVKRDSHGSSDYVIQENNNISVDASPSHADISPAARMKNNSFATDLANEIGLVLSKYRNESTTFDGFAQEDASFDFAQGKLYCA